MSELPDFRAYCADACMKAWGEPDRKNQKSWRWGKDAYDYKSFDVRKRLWYDAGAKCGGSTLELAQHERGKPVETPRGAEFFEAWRYAYDQRWLPDPPPEKKVINGGGKPILATYPYHDENGELRYEVVRFDTTDRDDRFRYRRPNKGGGWTWDLKGVKRTLYRLPELIAGLGAGNIVLICEGERDANTAVKLGCVATTNSEGAGKWRDEFDKYFAGADVVIIADNDDPGRNHAADVARHLKAVAARVRVVVCPKKDLSEWIAAGGTREQLDALIEAAESTGIGERMTLDAVHAVSGKWLGKAYDTDTLDAILAVTAAERLSGIPPWLMIVSGSGNAKTETIQAAKGAGAHVISTIASEGALLSASPKKQRGKNATGGLLRAIGERGILAIKDFTSIISANRDLRQTVLAALREVHDGEWVRNVGSDGGQTIPWRGRIVIIAACTTAWDSAHAVIASCGDRFVVIRPSSDDGRIEAGRQAIRNTGVEVQMQRELAQAFASVVGHVDPNGEYQLTEDEVDRILTVADLVTLARTGVEVDYRGDVVSAHAPEMPTRFAKQLTQIMRGGLAIGMPRDRALALAIRCARDSMPPMRFAVLKDLASNKVSKVLDIRRRLQKPRSTTDRTLQALHVLGLLTCHENEEIRAGKPVFVRSYSLARDSHRVVLAGFGDDTRNVSR
jgi:hypothetical protein